MLAFVANATTGIKPNNLPKSPQAYPLISGPDLQTYVLKPSQVEVMYTKT